MDNINIVKEITLTVEKKSPILHSWTKYLEQSKGIRENWKGLGKFNICILNV